MINQNEYWMGRDLKFSDDLTDAIRSNADALIAKVNKLLLRASVSGVKCECHPTSKSPVTSGWRPPSINRSTPGAAVKSKHMTGQAIDLYDPDGEIDDWCMGHQGVLAEIGLYMEHPSATKGWCHLQTVPPRSGLRVFYP